MKPIKIYPDPSIFLKECSSFLCLREAENNLILGIAGILGTPASFYRDFHLGSVGGTKIEGACLLTPPHKLILSSPTSDRAMDAMMEEMLSSKRQLPGVNACSNIADRFAKKWAKKTGIKVEIAKQLFCYNVFAVSKTTAADGFLRKASSDDFDLIVSWGKNFDHDINEAHDHEKTKSYVKNAIHEGQLYLWEDKKPVSMLRTAGATPSGVRITYVYTPPEHRRQGYASALVAEVSRIQLSTGRSFCFLFTDAKNPTSNKIYQRIGYEKVCEFHEYTFTHLL